MRETPAFNRANTKHAKICVGTRRNPRKRLQRANVKRALTNYSFEIRPSQ